MADQRLTSLLRQTLALTANIQQRSPSELKSSINEIESLADTYQQLLFCLRRSKLTEESHTPEERNVNAGRCVRQSSVSSILGRTRKSGIAGTIESAFYHLPFIYDAVWHFHTPFGQEIDSQVRMTHIQNILGLRKRKLHIASNSSERILVLCASISIARDFRDFERRGGWKSKQDILFDRFVKGEELAIQTVGKNFQRYLASHNFGPPSNLQKLDAALRLGMKLALVDQLGSRLSKGRRFSLILGFTFDKFAKLSFASLNTLCETLNDVDTPAMQEFVDVLGPWWSKCQNDYHCRFSDMASPQTAVGWTNSSSSPLLRSVPSAPAEVDFSWPDVCGPWTGTEELQNVPKI